MLAGARRRARTAWVARTRGAATCEPTRLPAPGEESEGRLARPCTAQEHAYRCMCVQEGEGMARCLQTCGCCCVPHLRATPPTAKE